MVVDLLPQVLDHEEPYKRVELIASIENYHRARGGTVETDLTATVKKALAMAEAAGVVVKLRQGYYRLGDGEVQSTIVRTVSTKTSMASAELSVRRMHPVVAEAVAPLWRGSHYRETVEQAARAVNNQAQLKLRRYDASETALFNDAFSPAPPASGKPRFRFLANHGEALKTTENRLRGARAFAEGCYAAIRAVAAHEARVGWTQEVALEYTAAFSILARWVDEAEVHRID